MFFLNKNKTYFRCNVFGTKSHKNKINKELYEASFCVCVVWEF